MKISPTQTPVDYSDIDMHGLAADFTDESTHQSDESLRPASAKISNELKVRISPQRHGQLAWWMACVAEAGVFILAMLLVVFNVQTVWISGNWFQGVLLAAGWFVVGLIDLSIIIMAGALRLCRWSDKPIAAIGVMCAALFCALTVYQFNEFASYYLTEPARTAAVQVENMHQKSGAIRVAKANLAQRHQSTAEQRTALDTEIANRVAAIDREYKTWADTLQAENLVRVAALESTLPKAPAADQGALDQIRDLEEKIRRRESSRGTEIAEADRRSGELRASDAADVASRRADILAQRSSLEDEVRTLRQTMLTEMEGVSGLFKGLKKDSLRRDYDEKIKVVTDKIADLDKELRQLQPLSSGEQGGNVEAIRAKAQTDIAALEAQIERLRAGINQSVAANQRKNDPEASRFRAEIARVQQEFQSTLEQGRNRHDAAVSQQRREHGELSGALTSTGLGAAEFQRAITTYDAEEKSLADDIGKLETATETAMEPIFYFRIAQWYHHGKGLPSKDDYLNGQIYLFAPIGLGVAFLILALAYVGTGLKIDGYRSFVSPDGAARELRNAQKKIQFLEGQVEKQDVKITDLGAKVIQGKINFAEAVSRITQSIFLRQPPSVSETKN